MSSLPKSISAFCTSVHRKVALRTRIRNGKARLPRLLIQSGCMELKRRMQLKRLRKKDCISVIFPIDTFSKWKSDGLLRLLIRHPRFKPSIRLTVYDEKDTKAIELNHKLIREYADSLGVPCLEFASYDTLPHGFRVDLVILSEPYDTPLLQGPQNKGLTRYSFCYIPYGFYSIGSELNMNSIINNTALFNFYENEASRQLASSLMDNKGSNVCITGHAMADAFLFSPDRHVPAWKDCGKPLKKVIWAPHWTITDGLVWFASGNFLSVAEQMTKLAEQYREEIQFAFKPHPLLHRTLCKHPDWGKERADAFYRKWAEMPNTQLEEGAYTGLFMQSDACIHDCGSFIIEYMFADKPALFLMRGEGYQGYSPMAQQALACYTKGHRVEDIERFLQSLLQGEDTLQEQRQDFRTRYLIPPHGQSAAQNIIDCLLGEGAYAQNRN